MELSAPRFFLRNVLRFAALAFSSYGAFWISFAAGLAVVAAAGHAMSARWHLGPITGFHFWAVLVTSPEVLVFLFFMITDPKTTPKDTRARAVYAVSGVSAFSMYPAIFVQRRAQVSSSMEKEAAN